MMDPFIGEIRCFGFNFAPPGWAMCNGQLLAITQNTALFSILVTSYCGDGRTTFALPNMQGKVAMGEGQGNGLTLRTLGEVGGAEAATLTVAQMPPHIHAALAANRPGNTYVPQGGTWAKDAGGSKLYGTTGGAQMAADTLSAVGGGQPHANMQPYRVLNFCIAVQGIFPPRN
ncbi:MAG: phage tail protein [Methylococcaceae bacterium]|nr:phage tail protein [Methylococcaceae bacterium]